MRKILLFDTIIDGHHADYLCHLVNYWLHTKPEGELIVVAQASFEPMFHQLLESVPSVDTVRFVPISQQEIDDTHKGSLLGRPFREWNLHLAYSRKYKATHVLLMYFDIFQLGFWLGKKAPCAVSGIYFRPDFHYTTSSGLKARLNVLRKKTTLRGVLRKSMLLNLFCLDHSAVTLVREMNPRVNVVPLPDPVKSYVITSAEREKLRDELQLDPNRRVFILFGHLDQRKGIEPFLEAINQLAPELQQKLCFLLVGAISPDYQAQIEQKISQASPNLQIVGVFKEVKGREIQVHFELADYVLTLYQRHVGMASVIIRAAVSDKPLVSSDYGYMGHLVQTEQFGNVTDSASPAAICQLLEQILVSGISYSKAKLRKLAEQNSDVSFAKTIFDRL
ncbi:glycosyltransferase [Spirosoma validum]|uniref:Glycosyltransferase n=1 Tax=Spirosoma validum TaxID=2771355 RepID=A0A927B897_9BACT|nr:glycosyltransferase [Spirosoma validum]MBD2757549.1 glycosyltransferase [Spirosoma validum]